jgi:putative flippase GtrA
MTDEGQVPEHRRFARFLIVGGFAALVNVVCRAGLNEVMEFRLAVFLAYLIGMGTAFSLSKLWVFEPSGRTAKRELAGFALVNAFAVLQVWLVSVALVEWLFPSIGYRWQPELIAHCIGVASPIVTSYLGHKHVSFRPKGSEGV